jgi:hypothetical protein
MESVLIIEKYHAAIRLAPNEHLPELALSSELLNAPQWYPFELRAWEIGENIRSLLKANKKLRSNDELLSAIAAVIDCENLRRGRQSFFFSLEFVKAQKYAPRVATHLSDSDVRGHALKALLKMRVPGYSEVVRALLNDEQLWIRRLARKYIERYGEGA